MVGGFVGVEGPRASENLLSTGVYFLRRRRCDILGLSTLLCGELPALSRSASTTSPSCTVGRDQFPAANSDSHAAAGAPLLRPMQR